MYIGYQIVQLYLELISRCADIILVSPASTGDEETFRRGYRKGVALQIVYPFHALDESRRLRLRFRFPSNIAELLTADAGPQNPGVVRCWSD